MEEGPYRPWSSETSEPIKLKFGTFYYVQRPTERAKYGGRRSGVSWGDW